MAFTVIPTKFPEVLLLKPQVFGDQRGFFMESFNQREFQQATGSNVHFVQDNHSESRHGVLRGLHYQIHKPQGKLVRVVEGEVFDVVVDLRPHSPHYAQWEGCTLSAENPLMRWIPAGFAHGFLVTSAKAALLYKCTEYWQPDYERSILWSDPTINIDWPLTAAPTLSAKDAQAPLFASLGD